MKAPRAFRSSSFVLLGFLATPLAAQFDYSLSFDTEKREWSVEGRFGNDSGEDIDFWIARWTPGAYHLADYGRYVQGVRARNGDGKELEVERVSDSHFRITAEGAREITVDYIATAISTSLVTQEGMVLDVESNRITPKYAYVTPVSLFGFVPGRLDEPYSLDVELPDKWKSATVLKRDDKGIYRAASYYRFEDSPLFFSPTLTTVNTSAAGRPLDVTVHGRTGDELREVVEGCVSIAEAACALMGGAPYDRYHFLIGFVPEAQGSGLEHSFSTLVLVNSQIEVSGVWGLIAHEFFHLWCAERIHVEGIRNPDYTKRFETGTIWVNESMTEYMTQHVLLQAGIFDERDFFAAVAPTPQLDMMTKDLPAQTQTSRDAGGWESMQDLMKFAMKMYAQGSRTMFGLDMAMRRVSKGERGVVDALRYTLAEYSDKGRGFPEGGMVEILGKVAGGDLSEFYDRHIDGTDAVDFDEYLDVIGCELDGDRIQKLENPTDTQAAALADFFAVEG